MYVGEGVVCGGGGVACGDESVVFHLIEGWVEITHTSLCFGLHAAGSDFQNTVWKPRVGRVWCGWVGGMGVGWGWCVGVKVWYRGEGVVVGVRMWYVCVCKKFCLADELCALVHVQYIDTCNGYQIHRQVRLVRLD